MEGTNAIDWTRSRADGCGAEPDASDWADDCEAQAGLGLTSAPSNHPTRSCRGSAA